MKKISLLIIIICSICLCMTGCYYDKEQLLIPPKTDTATCITYSFALDVSPILQTSCNNGVGCHAAGSTNGPGALETYTEVKTAASLVQASILAGRMPLNSRMSSADIHVITCWINTNTAP